MIDFLESSEANTVDLQESSLPTIGRGMSWEPRPV